MIFYHIDIKNKKYYFNIFSNKKLLKNNYHYIPYHKHTVWRCWFLQASFLD